MQYQTRLARSFTPATGALRWSDLATTTSASAAGQSRPTSRSPPAFLQELMSLDRQRPTAPTRESLSQP